MTKEITLFTIANQGAKLLDASFKDSNVIGIINCPFVIQTFCSYNPSPISEGLRHFELNYDLDKNDLSQNFVAFKKTVLVPVIAELSSCIKNCQKKYAAITMDSYPESEVSVSGHAALRVRKWWKVRTKENMLTFEIAFFEMEGK